jgi:hypothetical protein
MKSSVGLFIVVLALSLSANAMVSTYTVSFGDSYSGGFNIDTILSVPQFDSSLGTLLDVTIDFDISAFGTIGFENTTANPVNRTIYTYFYFQNPVVDSTRGTLELSFNSSVIADLAWDVRQSYAMSLTGFDGAIDFAGGSGFFTTYLNQADGGLLCYDSNLSAFIGSSTVDFQLVGEAFSALAGMPGNGVSQVRTLGAGNVTITYNYIPEPMTICLLGFGALSLLRRK